MYNISSIKEANYFNHYLNIRVVYTAIVRCNSETIISFEQNIIANTIFCYLYAIDGIRMNNVLVSSNKLVER